MTEYKYLQLIVKEKMLYTPFEAIVDPLQRQWAEDCAADHASLGWEADKNSMLICRHDSGDCDTIEWPNPDQDNLRSALYDAREMGIIPGDTPAVKLPDGTLFDIG